MKVFFDFVDGDYRTDDDEGHDCDGPDAARAELLQVLPEILLGNRQDVAERQVDCTVRTECGTVLYRASVTLKIETSSGR